MQMELVQKMGLKQQLVKEPIVIKLIQEQRMTVKIHVVLVKIVIQQLIVMIAKNVVASIVFRQMVNVELVQTVILQLLMPLLLLI